MSDRFQVIAECAHVKVTDHSGVSATHLLYKGAFLPDEVDKDRLKFLIEGGFVEKVGDTPIAPNAAVEQDPARGLDSVTADGLRGEKPEDPRQDPALRSAEKVADVVTQEASVARAAEAPRPASDDSDVEARRATAQAKLPADGSVPDGRAGKDVFVEYLARNGYDFAELAKQDPAELKSLAKKVDADRRS